MSLGSIPWRDSLRYAHHYGLEQDLIDPFIQVIRAMDVAYLEWMESEREKGNK